MIKSQSAHTTSPEELSSVTPEQVIANICQVMLLRECRKKLQQLSLSFWSWELSDGLPHRERSNYVLFMEMMDDLLEAAFAIDARQRIKEKPLRVHSFPSKSF